MSWCNTGRKRGTGFGNRMLIFHSRQFPALISGEFFGRGIIG
jgi:hypothetical protein